MIRRFFTGQVYPPSQARGNEESATETGRGARA